MVGLSGEKFIFLTQLEQPNCNNFQTFVKIDVVLLINFPEQLELCLYFKYSNFIRFFNLGDKSYGLWF